MSLVPGVDECRIGAKWWEPSLGLRESSAPACRPRRRVCTTQTPDVVRTTSSTLRVVAPPTPVYAVVDRLIDEVTATGLYVALLLRGWRGETRRDDQVPDARSYWGDATLDAFLLVLRPHVERVVGRRLLPTYSYARIYGPGDELKRHHDRAECEVAVSIHLGHRGGSLPPLCFESGEVVRQRPGDAVVFRGDRVDHWRAPFDGESLGQLLVNYVFSDGDRSSLRFDGREAAYPPSLRPATTE